MLGKIYSAIRRVKRSSFLGHGLINQMYYDPKTVILKLENLDYVAVDGCKFHANDQIDSLQRVEGNPWFRNIRPDDVVLDIGANIGAIAIPLAKVARKVYAVEPLYWRELEENVKLNGLMNITALPFGIGRNYSNRIIEFSSRMAEVPIVPFTLLKWTISHIDFLKMDGEGCEWGIEPEEMAGIRELRIEFHIRRWHKKEDWAKEAHWEQWLDENGYEWSVDYGAKPGPCVPYSDCVLVNASLAGGNEKRRKNDKAD